MNDYRRIPLSSPDITEKEILSVIDVLKTPNLSLGPKLVEFEQKFAKYVGSAHAVAVNSGTSGLHLAVKSLSIGPNDAVITTPFSFVASANCMLYESALPIFVDIDPDTFNIDVSHIESFLRKKCRKEHATGKPVHQETGKIVKAILPVHIFGLSCEMDRLMQLAYDYNLHIIEDACEAVGADFRGKMAGTFGDLGVFAFYPNKQMTTGEGGIIVTDDEDLARLCRSFRNQGRDSSNKWLSHVRLGYNYRMNEIQCALGIAQLERIDEILEKRKKVASQYNELLRDIVKVPDVIEGYNRSWFVYVVSLPEAYSKTDRDDILSTLIEKGVACNNYFPPIHLQPLYQDLFGYKQGEFEVTESLSSRTISLPFHNNLTDDEILYVANTLRDILQEQR